MSFFEKSFHGVWAQCIGDEQVAIRVPEVELFGSEAAAEVGGRWWRHARGHCVLDRLSSESCAEREADGSRDARARGSKVEVCEDEDAMVNGCVINDDWLSPPIAVR